MHLKKVYIEITNRCNLNCSFCIKNERKIIDITKDNYVYIIDKIKKYTNEIYLHILGEPLMHKDINYFIDYASSEGLLVNITTNGYLINAIRNNRNIHRLNISLHSFDSKYNKSEMEYISDIFNVIDSLRDKTYVTLRLWVGNIYTNKFLSYINNRYDVCINNILNNQKIKVAPNLLIDSFHEFIWPDLNNNYYSEIGTCRGLIDHIGILSNGDIVPCCLDSMGILKLGNIYEDNIEDIFEKKIVNEMINGFRNNKKVCELCKHCSFLEVNNENIKME